MQEQPTHYNMNDLNFWCLFGLVPRLPDMEVSIDADAGTAVLTVAPVQPTSQKEQSEWQ